MSNMDKSEKIYKVARILDKGVNTLIIILFILLLLYAGYSLWYTNSIKNDSFLSDELAQYKPGSGQESLEGLMKMNPDVTSWIVINGTNIDYPVVQGDEEEEYLNKSVLGEFSLAGSIFLSTENERDFSDPYNLVYGHHVEGGAMLADVLEFRNASFFKKHKLGTLWYPDKDGKARADRIEIFAVIDTNGDDRTVYQDPGKVKAGQLKGIINHVKKKAVNKRDPGKCERIIALSTCENAVSFERVLLFGKLVPMTDKEIQKAKEASSGGETTSKSRLQRILGIFAGVPPWALITGGILLLILLIYVGYRIIKR